MNNLNRPSALERPGHFMLRHVTRRRDLIVPLHLSRKGSFLFMVLAVGCGSPSEGEGTNGGQSSGGAPTASGGDLNDPGSGGGDIGASGGVPGTGGASDGTGGASVLSSGGAPVGGGGLDGSGGVNGDGGSPSGGQTGFSTNRDDFALSMGSLCSAAFTVCENFETTAPGGLPTSLTLGGYGTRTVEVTESESARGARSLQIDVDGGQGAVVAMLSVSNIESLSEAHFGRMFYRVEGPGVGEFVHFDVLEAAGPWLDHQNGVRFASTGTGVGTSASNWSWIYNVQPFDGGGSEFGSEGDRSSHPVVDEWMCLEWQFDFSSQTATYYHDGSIIDYLVIDDERSEIPPFTSISVGLQKFQTTGAFRVWLDELALDETRIGCNY